MKTTAITNLLDKVHTHVQANKEGYIESMEFLDVSLHNILENISEEEFRSIIKYNPQYIEKHHLIDSDVPRDNAFQNIWEDMLDTAEELVYLLRGEKPSKIIKNETPEDYLLTSDGEHVKTRMI